LKINKLQGGKWGSELFSTGLRILGFHSLFTGYLKYTKILNLSQAIERKL
jgi:hypothetical protein